MRASRHLLLVLLAVSLAGCVMHRDVARSSVSFNLAVEQAQNEMLVVNAIRSSLRRPMYITGIQSVTGSLSTEVSAGLSIPIGKKTETNLSTLGGKYTDHPTFNVAVFETQEFMRGFTAPIAPELLAHYWDQGWSSALLLHLLVEQIRVTLPGETSAIFDNYPDAEDDSLCHHVRFALFVEALVAFGADLRLTEAEDIGPTWSAAEIRSGGLAPLITAHKEKLKLTYDKKAQTYQLKSTTMKAGLIVPELNRPKLQKEVATIIKDLTCSTPPTRPLGTPGITGGTTKETDVKVELFLRSPEAVLYYLGELVRVETQIQNKNQKKKVPAACIRGKIEPIFVARQSGPGCRGGVLETNYYGESYFIPERAGGAREKCRFRSLPPQETNQSEQQPQLELQPQPEQQPELYRPVLQGCDGGRSMQALSLVSEIISLQKSAEDLPAPSVLRTID